MALDDLGPQNQKARGRGRPRTFARDEALTAAMHVFWQKGFDGTAMTDLVAAMGIASPSIYSAFGSKEQLFREVLEQYVRSYGVIIRTALQEERDLREAMRRAFREVVTLLSAFGVPRGCLVVLGVTPLGEGNVQSFVRDARNHLRDELRARFLRSSREDGLPAEADIGSAVAASMAFYNGLSIEMLDGADTDTVKKTVDLFVDSILRHR